MWQKDIGKDKAFRDNSRKVLFFLCLRRLFPVAGGVDRTALGFRLLFCRVNFPCFSPAIAAGNTFNGHGDKILVGYRTKIRGKVEFSQFFVKINKKMFGIYKIIAIFVIGRG